MLKIGLYKQIISDSYLSKLSWLGTGVFQKTPFFKNKCTEPALRLVSQNPKGFLNSTKFRGSSSHYAWTIFTLDIFTRPSLSPAIKNPFGFFQTNLKADAWRVSPISFWKQKSVFFWSTQWSHAIVIISHGTTDITLVYCSSSRG